MNDFNTSDIELPVDIKIKLPLSALRTGVEKKYYTAEDENKSQTSALSDIKSQKLEVQDAELYSFLMGTSPLSSHKKKKEQTCTNLLPPTSTVDDPTDSR